jgi:hypothetical protein
MDTQEVTGYIADLEVTLTIDGPDEHIANLCYADIVGRLDEIKQIVEEDIPPEYTSPTMTADWDSFEFEYHENEDKSQ